MAKKNRKRPTQRTMDALRKLGYRVGVVERFNHQIGPAGQRLDLFGFIDLIAIGHGETIGVQCCSATGFAEHQTKILNERFQQAHDWLSAGNVIELWGWKNNPRNGRARWSARVGVIEFDDEGNVRAAGLGKALGRPPERFGLDSDLQPQGGTNSLSD